MSEQSRPPEPDPSRREGDAVVWAIHSKIQEMLAGIPLETAAEHMRRLMPDAKAPADELADTSGRSVEFDHPLSFMGTVFIDQTLVDRLLFTELTFTQPEPELSDFAKNVQVVQVRNLKYSTRDSAALAAEGAELDWEYTERHNIYRDGKLQPRSPAAERLASSFFDPEDTSHEALFDLVREGDELRSGPLADLAPSLEDSAQSIIDILSRIDTTSMHRY